MNLRFDRDNVSGFGNGFHHRSDILSVYLFFVWVYLFTSHG